MQEEYKDVDSFKTFFTNHINTVAGRYDGKIFSWDVVNEALNEDGTMRKSIFLDKLGDNFVTEAFRLARQHHLIQNYIITIIIMNNQLNGQVVSH